jgi:hypothetical protein
MKHLDDQVTMQAHGGVTVNQLFLWGQSRLSWHCALNNNLQYER